MRTDRQVGGTQVFVAALALLAAGVGGKLLGVRVARRILEWTRVSEVGLVGWLLQTKALIMITFANVLLDRKVITSETFTSLLIMAVLSTMLTIPMVMPWLRRTRDSPSADLSVAQRTRSWVSEGIHASVSLTSDGAAKLVPERDVHEGATRAAILEVS